MFLLVNGDFVDQRSFALCYVRPGDLHIVALRVLVVNVSSPNFKLRRLMDEGECLVQENCLGTVNIEAIENIRSMNVSEAKFTETVKSMLSDCHETAPPIQRLLSQFSCCPVFARELLATESGLSVFESNGESFCIARKRAKPRYHRRLPKIINPIDVREILRRSFQRDSSWKQSGATFSTMMRHFQKTPQRFSWSTAEDHKTTIICS
jgi:hypothetical protein